MKPTQLAVGLVAGAEHALFQVSVANQHRSMRPLAQLHAEAVPPILLRPLHSSAAAPRRPTADAARGQSEPLRAISPFKTESSDADQLSAAVDVAGWCVFAAIILSVLVIRMAARRRRGQRDLPADKLAPRFPAVE